MLEIILDSFLDTSKMIPLLLIIYIGIELVEYKWGNKIRLSMEGAENAGPLIGSVSGIFPQCGFSVITTALYTQRLVTIGTLIAVYLSTSDEAIPIILSDPNKAHLIVPIIITKLFIAIFFGYTIDIIFRKKNKEIFEHIKVFSSGSDNPEHHHETLLDKHACCGHNLSNESKDFNFKEIFIHPIFHTMKIFVFIFITSLFIGTIISKVGNESLKMFFLKYEFLQPFFAALIGLIPNCASSVALTELYIEGIITYGAVIAGLSSAGGLGILVLLREEKSKKEVFKIVGLLLFISILVGLVLQYFV